MQGQQTLPRCGMGMRLTSMKPGVEKLGAENACIPGTSARMLTDS